VPELSGRATEVDPVVVTPAPAPAEHNGARRLVLQHLQRLAPARVHVRDSWLHMTRKQWDLALAVVRTLTGLVTASALLWKILR
jgi:hypothetical protein